MPQVEVAFDIDANGILHVSAKDRATGKEQKIRIEASSGLSDAEIDKMVKDAEAHASEDEERRGKVEARNQLDSLVYQVEKDSAEWGDKVSEASKDPPGRSPRAGQGSPQGRRRGRYPHLRTGRADASLQRGGSGDVPGTGGRGRRGRSGRARPQPKAADGEPEAGAEAGEEAPRRPTRTWSKPTTRSSTRRSSTGSPGAGGRVPPVPGSLKARRSDPAPRLTG